MLRAINILPALLLLVGLSRAQTSTQTTPWVHLQGASTVVQDGNLVSQQRRHVAIEAFAGSASELRAVRSEIVFTPVGSSATPFLYGTENLSPSVVPGYSGMYGGIMWIHATRARADAGPTRRLLFGTSFYLGMCGGASLNASDGNVDYQGASGHLAGAGASIGNISGPGFEADYGPGSEDAAGLWCASTPGGPLEITLAPQALGAMTQWPGWEPGNHKPWSEMWAIQGSHYAVDVRLHYDYVPAH